MKKTVFALIFALLPLAGCEEKKKPVDIKAPGVDVKVGDGQVDVNTPGADVKAGGGEVDVTTPNRKVEVDAK